METPGIDAQVARPPVEPDTEATMDRIAQAAEDVLLGHPHPALRLAELLEVLTEHVDRTLNEERLRRSLEGHPGHFRILEAWRRRWPTVASETDSTGRQGLALPEHRGAWVIAVDGPPGLRESVRWLGRGVDDRSRLAVGRWYAIAVAERDARRVIARRSPPDSELPPGYERRAS
jgi:hypothetical protein